MKPFLRLTWKFTGVFLAITISLTSVLSYYGYKILLSPETMSAMRGPEEGYSWPISQYQLFFGNLETLIALGLTELDQDTQKMELAYHILKSKYNVISQPSELSRFFDHIPEYRPSLLLLSDFMQQLDGDFSTFLQDTKNREVALKMLRQFEEIKPTITQLSNEVRLAEVQVWEEIINDFYQRRSLYLTGLLLWLFFVIWVGMLLFNVKRSRQLIQQQRESIAAERRATQAVTEAIAAKNSFIAMISHELRTPLQTIMTIIDLLLCRTTEEKLIQPLRRLESASLQLEAQMKDLTDYARLDADRLEIRKSTFDLSELVRSLIDNFSTPAKKKGLLLTCHEIETKSRIPKSLLSDPYRIQQIVGNLISNAIKYTEMGRIDVAVRLTVTEKTPLLHFAISDTGPGIAPDQLEKIFQPFTQLDQSNTRRYDGAGLGLAIVNKLLQLLEGTITTKSIAGTGSTFEVTIPVEFSTEKTEETDVISPEEKPTQSRPTVLVVDDNDDARASISEMVIEAGFACETSASANDALTRLFKKPYQLVLLDIQMPDKDGFEVVEELHRKNGPNRNTVIIAISAHSPELLRPEQKNLFHQYLMKPVRYETLRSLLVELLHLKNE